MPLTPDSTPSIPPACVLVIDDEAQIRRFLDISLRAQGYRVLQASSGQEGLERLVAESVDLVILDIGLPDMEGHQVLTELRQWSQLPVIMLTVRAGEAEKVRALDAGANDYVTKPFGTQELMARVRMLLRTRAAPLDGQPPVFDDGHLRIDLVHRAVTLDGVAVPLTRKEYALLSLLLVNAGRVVTQPQILKDIWGPTHQHDTHYLRILVGKLRQKLGDSALESRYVFTEPGVGLRFKG
ncbi:MAG: response regulator transcription factor [Stenotrophomonas sp.]|jgi:two-component system KDP operon response regulator KdpE|uniref:response regulator n=1 Tax=Stenotrophomonas TaxID=40323 RepID=UPI000C32D0DA|nr:MULTISPECIES: response regulator transcription factor [Stenotrophomonas]MDX3931401.1 response regulator transcription factor [Stenotrophomonas sp.]PKH76084.1 DNA-binding response regulator [Stenotrophomonas sp. Betaine-02u-23]PKH77155.1 DNA-binding response regulator [Stenotrophomonas sp. Betaine-02u-21]PKH97860.1 DNA-binding response regulator [Stenotrophomonas sp. Bg11-02]